ncbi:MAG: pilin [Patescibacteria group bacterium]|nr:MAG: pilin [Patescibacteria group bacterium]
MPEPIKTEIAIPIAERVEGYTGNTVTDLANYIGVIYQFMISIIGVVAAVMMIIGGFQYLTSAGDAGKIGAARKRITDALIGLVLAFSAYLLLNTINPALLSFEPIGNRLSPVRTITASLPFCEQMAKTLKLDLSQITQAKMQAFPQGCNSCGCAGYLQQPSLDTSGRPKLDGNGQPINSRIWCIFRGDRATPKERGGGVINSGCGEEKIWTAEAEFFGDGGNNEFQPSVCVPTVRYGAEDLEKAFVETGMTPHRNELGRCQACATFGPGARIRLGYVDSAQACQAWMNVANNGNAQDNRFTVGNKSETNFVLDTSRPSQMYYCGYSSDRNNCVYGNVRCETHVNSCDDYDSEYITFCDQPDSRGGLLCKDEELQSFTGGSYGAHLGPICQTNPCGVGGGCGQSGIIEALNGFGSSGGFTSTVFRGSTFGLWDPSACD